MPNTHDTILETIQSVLDEQFVDAHNGMQTIIALKVKEQLAVLRESTATSLYETIDKKKV